MPRIKMSLMATSAFLLLVRMQPGKWPEGEIGSLGTTLLAKFLELHGAKALIQTDFFFFFFTVLWVFLYYLIPITVKNAQGSMSLDTTEKTHLVLKYRFFDILNKNSSRLSLEHTELSRLCLIDGFYPKWLTIHLLQSFWSVLGCSRAKWSRVAGDSDCQPSD